MVTGGLRPLLPTQANLESKRVPRVERVSATGLLVGTLVAPFLDNDPAVRCIRGRAQQPVTYGSVAAARVHRSITPCIHVFVCCCLSLQNTAKRYGSYGCYVPRNMQCMPGKSCRYAVVRTNWKSCRQMCIVYRAGDVVSMQTATG